MPTEIRELAAENGATILRIAGEMLVDDALLVKRLAENAHERTAAHVILDLADLDYIDSEAAHVLRKLETKKEFSITGIEIFLQTAVNEAERRDLK